MPDRSPRTADALARFFHTHRATLVRYVASRFPSLCRARVEDAVATGFVVALEHPDRFARAVKDGGDYRLLGLFRVIAWRAARADVGRSFNRSEIQHETTLRLAGRQKAGQHLAASIARDLDHAFEAALLDVGTGTDPALRAAVLDRFRTGDSDTEVAARHGIRREYINRAKRAVQREVTSLLEA